MGQDKTLVLLVHPQSLIFDKSCIFIGGHFTKIIKNSTGSKGKDSMNLKTSPLDFCTFKMYIWTPKFSCVCQSQAKLYIMLYLRRWPF